MDQKIKIIHVDDNSDQLILVAKMLAEFDDVELVKSFDNAIEAKNYLKDNQVDLAILDIEMKGYDGLWLAEQISDNGPLIVFLTSHPELTLKAFDACAIHYIIKPVTKFLVMEIIERYKKICAKSNGKMEVEKTSQFNELVTNYLTKESYPKRIFINNVHKTIVINLDEVLYFVSAGPYTVIKLKDGSKQTASKLLKLYSEVLVNHPDFVRIHRGHMINKNYVTAILRNKHIILAKMIDGEELEVSPQKREEIYEMIKL